VTGPLGAAEFDRLMRPLGPFESSPQIAVALSGGADSMALMLRAAHWAKAQGGCATGVTVDHGLRAASSGEVRRVKSWLAARGIRHASLRWTGPKPHANLQAEARAARYRLLEQWCRTAGILHLLLAHQIEDQAETLLLRLARGSGVDGLAAMAAVSETAQVRLLRPLLGVSRGSLVALLESQRQKWIEDPSNEDERYGRVRWRALLPALAREGLGPERLAGTAQRQARARQVLEDEAARLLARAVALDPAGYAILLRDPFAAAPAELGLRALGSLLRCVGGGDYGPRLARLERLYREIVADGLPAARTLGGCRVLRLAGKSAERLLICREPGAVEGAVKIAPGAAVRWDGRFEIALSRCPRGARGALRIAALGERGWTALLRRDPGARDTPIPAPVRLGLPALFAQDGPLAVPHLTHPGATKPGREGAEAGTVSVHVAFRPSRRLASGPGGVV
jgi:tRNA(Ile)-lysidine synthase